MSNGRQRQVLLDGLRRLEYRGYDSAGVAVISDGQIIVRKSAGKLSRLAGIAERSLLEESRRDRPHAVGHPGASLR